MADVHRLRADLRFLAREIGAPLTNWQAASLTLETPFTVIVAPRQSGKSRCLAVLALWRALREPEQSILIVSASEEASRRVLRMIRDLAGNSPLLATSLVDEQTQKVQLTNGSVIRSLSRSERSIRGWTATDLLLDEAALLPEEIFAAALPTVAARPGARIVMASSATTASGPFFDYAQRGEHGSEHVRTYRWLLGDAAWISPSWVEAQRESMTPARFAAEYEGVFASGSDALFTRSAIDRATADYAMTPLHDLRGPGRVLAGVDWGLTADRSALVAIGRLCLPDPTQRIFAVATTHRWPAGAPIPDVVEDIAASPAHFDRLSAEANGLGGPACQILWRRLAERPPEAGGGRRSRFVVVEERDIWMPPKRKLPPVPPPRPKFVTDKWNVNTDAPMKSAVFAALRLMLDQGRLVIPSAAEELRRELLMLRVDFTQTGVERIAASSGHDDLAMALAFASGPFKLRGEWRTRLAALANPRHLLPEKAYELGDTVYTGSGIAVPRHPALISVAGPEITAPPGARAVDPEREFAEQVHRLRRQAQATEREIPA